MSRSTFWPLMAILIAGALWLQTRQMTEREAAAPDGGPAPQTTPRVTAATAVAAADGTVWMGRDDGTLVVFEPEQSVRVVHSAPIHRLLVGPDGLFTASADGSAAFWTRDGAPRRRVRLGGRHLNDGVPLPDGSAVLAADKGMVARTGPQGWRVPGLHGQAAFAVAVSPDGREVASGGTDGRVVILGVDDGKAIRVLPVSEAWVTALAWPPQGLYVGDQSGKVTFWADAAGESPTRFHPAHEGAIVALSIVGERLLSGSADGVGRLSQVGDGQPITRFTSPDGSLLDVTLTPDAALSAHKDGRVRRWRVTDGQLLGTLPED